MKLTSSQIKNTSVISGTTVTDSLNTLYTLVGGGGGGGDMFKNIYDTNNNGKVDISEVAEEVPWTGIKNKPAEFTPSSHNHIISEVTGLQTALDGKQGNLVSSVNIKTINGESLLGSGNLVISGGGGTTNHGALTGLLADDHPQYHTDARGDVRYAPLSHTQAATNAHAADNITNTPAGGITATNVQAAINELDSEKANSASVREKLTAARTYYVRTDGSDSNSGMANTSGGAFLTLQKAIDVVAALDLSIYQVTIKLADGTYGGNVVPKNYVGDGPLVIEGNTTTPNNVVLSGTSGNLVFASALKSKYTFRKLKAQTSGSGSSCFYVQNGSTLVLDGVNFGPCVSVHILSADGSMVFVNSSYEVSGSAYAHWYASYASSIIVAGGATITLAGTPAFTVAWAFAPAAGSIRANGVTFTGSATGPRYKIALNSVVQTSAGATYLPGDIAGTTETGGQYT